MKRLFDIVASGCGLIVLSPLFIILAIWIKLDSKGPVFYRQVRVGRGNKDFRIFKFLIHVYPSISEIILSISVLSKSTLVTISLISLFNTLISIFSLVSSSST